MLNSSNELKKLSKLQGSMSGLQHFTTILITMCMTLVCSLIELEQYNVNNISKGEYMEAYP